MRRTLVWVVALFLPFAAPARAEERAPVTDAERDAAIQKGIAYLDKTVFRLPEVQGTPRKPFTLAAAGVVQLLAEDAGGTRSEHRARETVKRVADELIAWVDGVETRLRDPDALPTRHGLVSSDALVQYTWPLAAASVFFSELGARGLHKARALAANRRIVAILLDAQQSNGGFGHGRIRDGADTADAALPDELRRTLEEQLGRELDDLPALGVGYPATLVSTTNLVGFALGLARRQHGEPTFGAAFAPALERVAAQLREAQLPNGLLPYDTSQRSAGGDKTGVPRAGGAVLAWLALGAAPTAPWVQRATDALDENLDFVSEGHGSATFGLWLTAAAMHWRGDEAWRRFRSETFRRLLEAQRADGAFGCICRGKAFASTNDDRETGIAAFDQGTRAYVTTLTTWILLLDRTRLRAAPLPGDPGRVSPTTPR